MKYTTIIALLLSSTAAFAQPDVIPETIRVTQGIASYYRTDAPFDTVSVGNTNVVDVAALTDHSLLIEAHRIGTTNMLLLNRDKAPIRNVTVIVGAQGTGFVKVHNKAKLNSYTEFSCWPDGCQFVGENTVSEPAPLPRGYYNQTSNFGPSGGNPGVQPSIPQDSR
jgi:hypothetical protein